MNRLREKGFISDPVRKAKSVYLGRADAPAPGVARRGRRTPNKELKPTGDAGDAEFGGVDG